MNYTILSKCVFIDKCEFNFWAALNHGIAGLSERAYRQPKRHSCFSNIWKRWIGVSQRFADIFTQARSKLDPDEDVISIFDGASAHSNPPVPFPTAELKKLPPYSHIFS